MKKPKGFSGSAGHLLLAGPSVITYNETSTPRQLDLRGRVARHKLGLLSPAPLTVLCPEHLKL